MPVIFISLKNQPPLHVVKKLHIKSVIILDLINDWKSHCTPNYMPSAVVSLCRL